MDTMDTIFERIHCEWWQALLLLVIMRMYPIFKALAAILVARFVKPDLAKIALPPILGSRNEQKEAKASPKDKRRRAAKFP